jgi:hypothetical protein
MVSAPPFLKAALRFLRGGRPRAGEKRDEGYEALQR